MKKTLALLAVLVLVLGVQSATLAAKLIPDSQLIGPFDLEPALAGKVLLDVRLMEEIWQDGEIEGSVRVGLHSLLSTDKLPADKNAPLVVVSQDGSAGEIAVLVLDKLGYTNVKSLDGGINAWKMVGMPTKPVQRTGGPVAGGC